jgi:DNA-binding CsgD family transcriptional regulator/PAS domain-containing protein
MPTLKHLKFSQDQVLELITHIYDAGLDSSHWTSVLRNLTSVFQAHESVLRIIDTDRKEITRTYHYNKDPDWLKAYTEYFVKVDPWINLLYQSQNTIIECTHHLIPDRELRKLEIYSGYLEPTDTQYGAGGLIGVTPTLKTYFTFQRGLKRGGFTNEHLELVKTLSPHLHRSILINNKTKQLELEADTFKDSLSRINSAIILVNRHGNVLFANRSAEQLIQAHHGIKFGVKGIRLTHLQENKRLHELIAKATIRRSEDAVPVAGGLKYHYPGNENWLSILVSPLNPDHVEFDFATTRCALIFLSENHPKPELSAGIVAQIYNLTDAEAKITTELCLGLTVNEISDKLRISNNTIKTHLKSVFHKTDTKRQVELVNLINRGPAGIKYTDQD